MPEAFQEGRSEGKSIELEPKYSTKDVPGRCIKCLAEQKLDSCLMRMLKGESDVDEYYEYEALLDFLQSPESEKLRNESEKYLADGEKVTVRIIYKDGKPEYKLKVK
jgi:hypothetical protein